MYLGIYRRFGKWRFGEEWEMLGGRKCGWVSSWENRMVFFKSVRGEGKEGGVWFCGVVLVG